MSNQIAIQFPTQALLFDNIPVHFNSDAYLNATNIAKQFNKRVGNYLQTERTQEYIKELGDYLSVTVKTVTEQNQLVIVIQGGSPEQQGTWIHPKLAVDFARWLSPKFAVWCDVQIEKILGINTKYHGKKTTKDKRTALHEAIALLMTKSKYLHFKDCYKMIHQRFNVEHLDEIPEKKLPEAVKYVHSLICGGQQSMSDDNYELIRELTEAVLSQNFMMENVWKALMLINQKDMMYYSKYVLDSNVLARKVSIELGFKTKRGLPLVSEDLNTINFASGVRFTGVNPKWFNAPAW